MQEFSKTKTFIGHFVVVVDIVPPLPHPSKRNRKNEHRSHATRTRPRPFNVHLRPMRRTAGEGKSGIVRYFDPASCSKDLDHCCEATFATFDSARLAPGTDQDVIIVPMPSRNHNGEHVTSDFSKDHADGQQHDTSIPSRFISTTSIQPNANESSPSSQSTTMMSIEPAVRSPSRTSTSNRQSSNTIITSSVVASAEEEDNDADGVGSNGNGCTKPGRNDRGNIQSYYRRPLGEMKGAETMECEGGAQ
uniref:Uncharacterized protein n=3 Tax=Lotharella globosa TaxID=91324 RepID=A0A6V3KKY6_9EUKA|mmetsp:Transcript_11762/g.22558  ORF Transcript_11762/g.22558 Transcript_11762/m.22558 type:complete len:248 (+) Transcript_11762:653-1396(+)